MATISQAGQTHIYATDLGERVGFTNPILRFAFCLLWPPSSRVASSRCLVRRPHLMLPPGQDRAPELSLRPGEGTGKGQSLTRNIAWPWDEGTP